MSTCKFNSYFVFLYFKDSWLYILYCQLKDYIIVTNNTLCTVAHFEYRNKDVTIIYKKFIYKETYPFLLNTVLL